MRGSFSSAALPQTSSIHGPAALITAAAGTVWSPPPISSWKSTEVTSPFSTPSRVTRQWVSTWAPARIAASAISQLSRSA